MRAYTLPLLATSAFAMKLGEAALGDWNHEWIYLNIADRYNWEMLGWTEHCWNNDGEGCAIPTNYSSWDELEANNLAKYAKELGYTPMTWNRDSPSSERSVSES